MKKQEFEKMAKENGTVEYQGKTIYLTQQAHADNTYRDGRNGDLVYRAHGIDTNGNEYRVEWETTAEWDDHQSRDEYHDHNGADTCGWCEDESNACDWDSPSRVDIC